MSTPQPSGASAPLLAIAGRVVLISGASRGIGRAVAEWLLAEGFTLSLGVRKPDAVTWATGSERVLLHRYDATDRSAAQAWVAATVARFGRVDALVNNAGVLRNFTFDDLDEDALDEMWEVNVKAPYRLTNAAMPHLRQCGHGRIVNVVSVSGLRYKGGVPGYAITKHAAMALTHATRYAGWADGVRVTALCPNETRTDMTAGLVDGHDLMEPQTLGAVVSLLLKLPNNAAVNMLPINNLLEPTV